MKIVPRHKSVYIVSYLASWKSKIFNHRWILVKYYLIHNWRVKKMFCFLNFDVFTQVGFSLLKEKEKEPSCFYLNVLLKKLKFLRYSSRYKTASFNFKKNGLCSKKSQNEVYTTHNWSHLSFNVVFPRFEIFPTFPFKYVLILKLKKKMKKKVRRRRQSPAVDTWNFLLVMQHWLKEARTHFLRSHPFMFDAS